MSSMMVESTLCKLVSVVRLVGLCRNRKKSHFSFFQPKNFKTSTIKLMRNPTGVQMPYSELKFMQWVIKAS